MQKADLIIHPIGELATNISEGGPAHGREMSNVLRIRDGALAVAGGKIIAVGSEQDVLAQVAAARGLHTRGFLLWNPEGLYTTPVLQP